MRGGSRPITMTVASLSRGQAGYPDPLASVSDGPNRLWVCSGEVLPWVECRRAVAVVGARLARRQGVEAARDLGGRLASRGYLVVSGGALGSDTAAHRGALDAGGRTVAVLG